MQHMNRPAAFLVDMDDTLMEERDFVYSGYRAVAAALVAFKGAKDSEQSAADIFGQLRYTFLKYGRSGAFDRVCAKLDAPIPPIADLVRTYREHTPTVTLYPGVTKALAMLRKIAPIAIVTDGAARVQQSKFDALGLSEHVDQLVLCDAVGAGKPDPAAFRIAAEAFGVDPTECLIIGDDPHHDVEAAAALQAPCLRVRTGRFNSLPAPLATYQVDTFTHIPEFLNMKFESASWQT